MNRASILVVEDEAIVAADIEERLAALGYGVAGSASSGVDAVGRAAEEPPDLVLMDVMLRGPMDGIEAAAMIRERVDSPVVFLTASADRSTLDRLRTPGAYGYIRKPFDDRTLEMNIELALVRHATEQALAKTVAELEIALGQVRTLEGLLPICACCKNIRDMDGDWHRIEAYIAQRTEASFTHGYCPACAEAALDSFRRRSRSTD